MTEARDQVAVVAGAAAGIGQATAILLAERGVQIVCLDRDEAGARTTAERIGDRATALHVDVASPESVGRAIAAVLEQHEQVHALVNTVGVTGTTGVRSHEVVLGDFDAVLSVNLRGAFVLTQAVVPHMLAHGYGRIAHVASIAGKEGNPGMIAYSSSKAGLIGMIKAMGKEYAEDGIVVNALAPAVIRTALVDATPDKVVRYMTDRIPMRRTGELREAAEMLAWMVSPACSFTTGFTFDLSGGRATY